MITTKQKMAISALLTAPTVAQAARDCRIGERTLRRWLAEDATFRFALVEAEETAVKHVSRHLVELATQAVETVERVLNDPAAKYSEKLRAADLVLSNLLRIRELVDMEERLTRLEREVRNDEKK